MLYKKLSEYKEWIEVHHAFLELLKKIESCTPDYLMAESFSEIIKGIQTLYNKELYYKLKERPNLYEPVKFFRDRIEYERYLNECKRYLNECK